MARMSSARRRSLQRSRMYEYRVGSILSWFRLMSLFVAFVVTFAVIAFYFITGQSVAEAIAHMMRYNGFLIAPIVAWTVAILVSKLTDGLTSDEE